MATAHVVAASSVQGQQAQQLRQLLQHRLRRGRAFERRLGLGWHAGTPLHEAFGPNPGPAGRFTLCAAKLGNAFPRRGGGAGSCLAQSQKAPERGLFAFLADGTVGFWLNAAGITAAELRSFSEH